MGSSLRTLLAMTGLLLGVGCQNLVVQDTTADEYVPLTGGSVVLHEDLTIPPGTAHVYLQRGYVARARNLYDTSCSFEVSAVVEEPQILRAGRFAIVGAGIGRDEYLTAAPAQVAALGFGFGVGGLWVGRDDGAAMVMYVIVMRLESQDQPNVRNLTCRSAMDDPARVERLTLQDMQGALGPIATLRPAPAGRQLK